MFRRGLWFSTGVRKYVLIYCNRNFFQNHKVIHTLFGDYLHSGGDLYVICNKDNTPKCGWNFSTGVEGSLRVAIFVRDEWVVKTDLWANRSTNWSGLTYSPSPTHWPTPHNWWVVMGYNSSPLKRE